MHFGLILILSLALISNIGNAELIKTRNNDDAFKLLLAAQQERAVSFEDLPRELHDMIIGHLPTHKDKFRFKAVNKNARNLVQDHYDRFKLGQLLEKPLSFNTSDEISLNEALEDIKTVIRCLNDGYHRNEALFFQLAEWTDPTTFKESPPKVVSDLLNRLRTNAGFLRFLSQQKNDKKRKWQLDDWLGVTQLTPRQRWQRAKNWSQLSVLLTYHQLNDRQIFDILGYPAHEIENMPSVYSLQDTLFYRDHGYSSVINRLVKERFKRLLGIDGNNNRLDVELMFFMHLYYIYEPLDVQGFSPAVTNYVIKELVMEYVKAIVNNRRHLPKTVPCVEFIISLIVMIEEGYFTEFMPYIPSLIEKWHKTTVPRLFPDQLRQSIVLSGELDFARLDVVLAMTSLIQDYVRDDMGFNARYSNISLILESPEYISIEKVLRPLQLYVSNTD